MIPPVKIPVLINCPNWIWQTGLIFIRHHENNMVRLRIVSDTAPAAEAVTVEPSLEDLFLYHFGEDAQSERSDDYVD